VSPPLPVVAVSKFIVVAELKVIDEDPVDVVGAYINPPLI
jgi:hypothetical protein